MLTKKKIIKNISITYSIPEEYIDLFKSEGVYYLGGKLGCVLPMTEVGYLTLKNDITVFMAGVDYLIGQFEEDCSIVTYIESLDWEL